MNTNPQELALLCKALAHPSRIELLQRLAKTSCCNGDLVRCVPLAQSTISQHIKILEQAQLICSRADQQKRYYCINQKTLQRFHILISHIIEEISHDNTCPY